jgi:hypothetical protein
MRLLFIAVVLALAAVPVALEAQDAPAAVRTTPDGAAVSVVLTPQGIRRQTAAQTSPNSTLPKLDATPHPLLPARPTLLDVVTSLACTSMFARRPDSQGTDPAASAGR